MRSSRGCTPLRCGQRSTWCSSRRRQFMRRLASARSSMNGLDCAVALSMQRWSASRFSCSARVRTPCTCWRADDESRRCASGCVSVAWPPQRCEGPHSSCLLGVHRPSRFRNRARPVFAHPFRRPRAGDRPSGDAECVPRLDAAAGRQGCRDAARARARRTHGRGRTIAVRRVRRLARRGAEDRARARRGRRTRLRAAVRARRLIAHGPMTLRIDPTRVEEAAKELYIRALKMLPPDIKRGFDALVARETDATAQSVLGVMVRNIAVAERTDNLLCQDTGIPIYNVTIGRDVVVDGVALKAAIRKGCERATREYPLRSSVVHPLTRRNEHTSCGEGIPVIHVDFSDGFDGLRIEMIPKGSGSENNSWLRMAIPAEGVDAIKRFVVDCVLDAGGKTCPPTIVGVGVGGTADLCVHLAKRAATRPLGTACADPQGAALESELTQAVNLLGVGPQGLGGDATAFAVHVELAATHITMNPVAVNMQCHSARRASALFSETGIAYGY